MIESESLPVNEIEKCELQKAQIENELQKWMKINEYQALKEDQELEAREIKEDNHFAGRYLCQLNKFLIKLNNINGTGDIYRDIGVWI